MEILSKGTEAKNRMRSISVAGMALLILAAPATAGAHGIGSHHESNSWYGHCSSFDVPVALGEGQVADQKIHATYCRPKRWAHGIHQTDVLSAGSTYNSSYWAWPQDSPTYSYTQKTLKSGRATLAYDRIGSGESSHPTSTSITVTVDAFVLHQMISKARSMGHGEVNSIGHSYGSGIAVREAATYNDIDRLVVTGYLHTASNPAVLTGNYPANQDPAFAALGLDDGYITSKPGTRGTSFYSSSADPEVIAYDEVHKDITAATGLGSYVVDKAAPPATSLARLVSVPVLAIAGEQDFIFCANPAALDCSNTAATQANEAAYYTGSPSVTYKGVADTGHDIVLHPSISDTYHHGRLVKEGSFRMINEWIESN